MSIKKDRTLHLHWALLDVEPIVAEDRVQSQPSVVHALLPLRGIGFREDQINPGEIYRNANDWVKANLSDYGYKLKYMDELKRFENVQWKSEEDQAFYADLAKKVRETDRIQFGKFYPYEPEDEA